MNTTTSILISLGVPIIFTFLLYLFLKTVFDYWPKWYKVVRDIKVGKVGACLSYLPCDMPDDYYTVVVKEGSIIRYDSNNYYHHFTYENGKTLYVDEGELESHIRDGNIVPYKRPLFNLRIKQMPRIYKLLFWTGLVILFYKFVFSIDQIILFIISLMK